MAGYKTMIQELTEKLGFDTMKALMKAATPMTEEQLQQLRRAADAVMNRHQPQRREQDG
jgi:hypothetical protein